MITLYIKEPCGSEKAIANLDTQNFCATPLPSITTLFNSFNTGNCIYRVTSGSPVWDNFPIRISIQIGDPYLNPPETFGGIDLYITQADVENNLVYGSFPVTYTKGDAYPIITYIECNAEPPSECENNFDCPEGEKCVEGECVPCDDQHATHFQVRFEYEELVTTSDAKQVMYTLSSVYPIEGSEGQIIQGQETSGQWYYPRIRFCNSDGEARPYTGALAFYGYCNPDGSTALYSNNRNLTEKSWVIGQKAQADSVSNNPWSVPRLLVEFIEQSKIVWEVVCSGVDPEEFPPIEPVEPTEPEEPDEPTEPEEPTEPTEPTKPTEPDAPETGCECETYIGEQIARAANILYDGIILLKREMSVGFREIVVEMYEARKMNYQLSMFLQNQQYQVMQAQHQRLYEIKQILEIIKDDIKKGLVDNEDGLIDIVKTGLVEGEDGLIDIVKDFTDQYEPVTIENEYRTQSHRVIDNLDEVVNKL